MQQFNTAIIICRDVYPYLTKLQVLPGGAVPLQFRCQEQNQLGVGGQFDHSIFLTSLSLCPQLFWAYLHHFCFFGGLLGINFSTAIPYTKELFYWNLELPRWWWWWWCRYVDKCPNRDNPNLWSKIYDLSFNDLWYNFAQIMSINDWNREEPKCIPANFRCDGRSSKSYFVYLIIVIYIFVPNWIIYFFPFFWNLFLCTVW